jgi:hypothetical protein
MKIREWNSLQAKREGKKVQVPIGNVRELNRIANEEIGKRLKQDKVAEVFANLMKNFNRNKKNFYYDIIKSL